MWNQQSHQHRRSVRLFILFIKSICSYWGTHFKKYLSILLFEIQQITPDTSPPTVSLFIKSIGSHWVTYFKKYLSILICEIKTVQTCTTDHCKFIKFIYQNLVSHWVKHLKKYLSILLCEINSPTNTGVPSDYLFYLSKVSVLIEGHILRNIFLFFYVKSTVPPTQAFRKIIYFMYQKYIFSLSDTF